MHPILLAGHTRSLTKITYNSDGDLIFSCSKDNKPIVWFAHNGERLGTFDGHNGAVWDLSVTYDSSRLLTAGADNTCRLFEVSTGKQLFMWATETAVRVVAFAEGDQMAFFVTDATMGRQSTIHIIKTPTDASKCHAKPSSSFLVNGSKATSAAWSKGNKFIITGHEDGSVCLYTLEGVMVKQVKDQKGQIMDFQFGKEKEYFISASKDCTAIIYDANTLSVFRKFNTDRPCNSASLSPIRPHLMLGGGQDAMSVTTTSARQGGFETRFYHLVFEDEIGRVKGHFGPINTLAFCPDGTGFASGGEDGYIRLHKFDADYFKFKYPEEREV